MNADVPNTPPARGESIPTPYASEAFAATAPSTTRSRKGLPDTCAPAIACSTLLPSFVFRKGEKRTRGRCCRNKRHVFSARIEDEAFGSEIPTRRW